MLKRYVSGRHKVCQANMKHVNPEHSETKHIFEAVLWIFIVHRIWFYKNLASVFGLKTVFASSSARLALTPSYNTEKYSLFCRAFKRARKYLCLVRY